MTIPTCICCSSSIDDVSRRVQELVEKINDSRTSDQRVMDSFQEKLVEKVSSCFSSFLFIFLYVCSVVSCNKKVFSSSLRWKRYASRWRSTCTQSMKRTVMRCRWSCRSWQRCWRTALSSTMSSWKPIKRWRASERAWPLVRHQIPDKLANVLSAILFCVQTSWICLSTCLEWVRLLLLFPVLLPVFPGIHCWLRLCFHNSSPAHVCSKRMQKQKLKPCLFSVLLKYLLLQ